MMKEKNSSSGTPFLHFLLLKELHGGGVFTQGTEAVFVTRTREMLNDSALTKLEYSLVRISGPPCITKVRRGNLISCLIKAGDK